MQAAHSLRTPSLVAGFSLLLMAGLAGVATFAVLEPALASNELEPTPAMRLAVLAMVVVVALDVIVSIALFAVFRSDGLWLAAAAAGFRLAYSAVFLGAIAQLSVAMLPGADIAASAAAYRGTWDVSLALFGIHLGILGVLAWRSRLVPRIVAVLVALAGAGYLADSVAAIGFGVELGSAQFLFVGEVALLVVLIVQGLRLSRTQPPSAASTIAFASA